MMRFREVKQALLNILGTKSVSLGTFRVIGYQERNRAAEEVLDNSRLVEVFFTNGSFPNSAGSIRGSMNHDPTYQIVLTVAKHTEGDLSVINDPGSTPAERATALLTFKAATSLADESLDELYDVIFQTVMNALNLDLGLDDPIANKWVPSFEKEKPINFGEYVIITGTMSLECRVDEQVEGDTPVALEAIDTEIITSDDGGNDTNGKAGYLLEP